MDGIDRKFEADQPREAKGRMGRLKVLEPFISIALGMELIPMATMSFRHLMMEVWLDG